MVLAVDMTTPTRICFAHGQNKTQLVPRHQEHRRSNDPFFFGTRHFIDLCKARRMSYRLEWREYCVM